jgi:nucleoside-diphosphate-sugar epimerase
LKKKILITGVTGFLGSSLAKLFLSKDYCVVGLKRSFSNVNNLSDFLGHKDLILYDIDKISLEEIFIGHRVDIIINSATSSSNRGGDICQIMDANVIFPLKLLECAYKNGCKKFINAGVFIPNEYIDSYYYSKKIFLDSMLEYSKHLQVVDVHLQMLYGKNSSDTQFISKVILGFFNGIECLNLTKGLQKRDFIYIDDAVNAFDVIVESLGLFQRKYTKIELGNGNSVTIKYLIETLKELTHNKTTKLNFGSVEYRDNEIMDLQANTKLLHSLGWTPKVNFKDGLKKTVDDIKLELYND